MIRSTQVYCSTHSVPGYQLFWTQQTPNTQSRHLKSVFHFLRQCICEQEGTCIMWWKCSTHYCGIHFSAIVLYDEEIGAEYLNVQDVACGTNILMGLVGLVRYLQVGGGGVVFWLTAPILTWSTLKENSEQNSKILCEIIYYSNLWFPMKGTIRTMYWLLTHCRPDGPLIKYPQFPDLLSTLNVQPHNIFLLTFWCCKLCSWAPDCRNCM